MKAVQTLLAIALVASGSVAFAQQAASAPAAAASTYVAPPWEYKTKQLSRNEVDKLLGNPKKLVVIDVRRPDELVKYGTFPVVLNVQLKELEDALDYIPKDRVILTVSNRAHRAGAAGDLLTSKGFKVAGATGTEDYKDAGGYIFKIAPPAAPAAPASAASAASK